MSIALRRSQRSTRVPASGPSRTPGSTKNMEMSAYWVISPVFWRTQTPSAKLVRPEPMNEIICPNHTTVKARAPSRMGRLTDEIERAIVLSISFLLRLKLFCSVK